jgi:hypothetical protein
MNFAPLAKIMARYGLLAGIMGFGLLLGLFYMGKHPFLILPFFDFRIVLLGIFIFFGLKEFREFHQESILYFWQGMIGSFVLTAVFAAAASLLILAFGSWNETFVQTYITQFTEQASQYPPDLVEQIGKENLERNLMELQATTIGDLVKTYFVQSFIISFLLA